MAVAPPLVAVDFTRLTRTDGTLVGSGKKITGVPTTGRLTKNTGTDRGFFDLRPSVEVGADASGAGLLLLDATDQNEETWYWKISIEGEAGSRLVTVPAAGVSGRTKTVTLGGQAQTIPAAYLTQLAVFTGTAPSAGSSGGSSGGLDLSAVNQAIDTKLAAFLADLQQNDRLTQYEIDLIETPRSTPETTPTNLLGKAVRFNTTGGAITQPLPAALAGRTLAIGWDAGSAALTLTRDGTDVIGSGSATSFVMPVPGEVVTLHCTTDGRWRVLSGFVPYAALQAALAAVFDGRYPNPDQTGATVGKIPTVAGTGPTTWGLGWPDLPEAATVRTAPEATPTALLGRCNRFDTSAGAIVQPLPPAVPGAVLGLGLDAGTNLTYVADGTDKIGPGTGVATETVSVTGHRILHCTTVGRWRVRDGFTAPSVYDARFAGRQALRSFMAETAPRFDDFTRVPDGTALSTYGKTTSGHPLTFFAFRDATLATNPIPAVTDGVIRYRPDGTPEWRLQGSGAIYAWDTENHEIDEASMTYCFRPLDGVGNPTKASGVCLAVSKMIGAAAVNLNGVFSNAIHIAFGPDSFRATIMINNGVDATVISSPFESGDMYVASGLGLPIDGSPLSVIVKRTARDRIRIIIPGYLDMERTDSRIPDIWGPTIGREILRYNASIGTDAEPIILGARPGPPIRRARSISPGALLAGMPAGHSSAAPSASPFASGITVMFGFDPETPITITSLLSEVVAAYPAGTVASWAILAADQNWQPRKLIADLGATMALDSVGVKTLTPAGGIPISPRRCLLGLRVSGYASGATLRAVPYALAGFPNVRTSLGAGPFVSYVSVSEAYASSWPTTPTQWNASGVSAVPGFLCPAVLQWTET